MKVLLLVNEFPPETVRGTAMATAGLARALAENGWEVHVIVTHRDRAPAEEMVGRVRVYRLSTLALPWSRTAQRLVAILRLARRIRPDLVQGQAASCGLFAAVVGKALGVPSVTYVQGMDVLESGPLRRLLEIRPAVRYATRAVAITERLAASVAGYAAARVEVIPHGYQSEPILPEVADRAKQRMGDGGPHLLFVGHLEPAKGMTYLLSAVATLAREWPGLRLHVVGDGPIREALEAQAARDGISPHVIFHGPLPHAEVLAAMRAADLFVLPSLLEPFGIVLVEALNEGCPVVATTGCGSADAVTADRAGLVVPPGDPQALAEAIGRVLQDPALRAAMSHAARVAGERFRWEQNVKRFERLYRDLLAERR